MTGGFYSSDIGLFGSFSKPKTSVQLNRLEKVIDISNADGGDGSYRLLVDGSSFDGDGFFAANYGYSENDYLICDSTIPKANLKLLYIKSLVIHSQDRYVTNGHYSRLRIIKNHGRDYPEKNHTMERSIQLNENVIKIELRAFPNPPVDIFHWISRCLEVCSSWFCASLL
ncbi:hypothetical protein YC2023_024351 [Brassica napus]